jgi:hypothetical protein
VPPLTHVLERTQESCAIELHALREIDIKCCGVIESHPRQTAAVPRQNSTASKEQART